MGRILSEKKNWRTGLISGKRQLCMLNLVKEQKQPSVVILQQAIFYYIFILCSWLRIIRRFDQGVQVMNFPLKIFFNNVNHGYRAAISKKISLRLLLFYMAVTTCCYYEKVRRTIHTAIVWYLLKLTILIFSTKCAQKRYFQPKTDKMNTTIDLCIFELVEVLNFTFNK